MNPALDHVISATLAQLLETAANYQLVWDATRKKRGNLAEFTLGQAPVNDALKETAQHVREWTADYLVKKIEGHTYRFYNFKTGVVEIRQQRPTRLKNGSATFDANKGLLVQAIRSPHNGRARDGEAGGQFSKKGDLAVTLVRYATKSGRAGPSGLVAGIKGINSPAYFNQHPEVQDYWWYADQGFTHTRRIMPMNPGESPHDAVRTWKEDAEEPSGFGGYHFREAAAKHFAGPDGEARLAKEMQRKLRLAGFRVKSR